MTDTGLVTEDLATCKSGESFLGIFQRRRGAYVLDRPKGCKAPYAHFFLPIQV
jgi:predicted ATPase